MKSSRYHGKLIGALFILVLAAWFTGYALIESVISTDDGLARINLSRNLVITGVFFELCQVAGVIFLAVLFIPVLKLHSSTRAYGYLAFRIMESVTLVIIALSALLLVTISGEVSMSGTANAEAQNALAELFYAVRMEWGQMMVAVFFGISAILLNLTLYQTDSLPRFITVWGLIAGVLVLVNQFVLIFFQKNLGVFLGLPMLLNELVMGLWMIIKGFRNLPVVRN